MPTLRRHPFAVLNNTARLGFTLRLKWQCYELIHEYIVYLSQGYCFRRQHETKKSNSSQEIRAVYAVSKRQRNRNHLQQFEKLFRGK